MILKRLMTIGVLAVLCNTKAFAASVQEINIVCSGTEFDSILYRHSFTLSVNPKTKTFKMKLDPGSHAREMNFPKEKYFVDEFKGQTWGLEVYDGAISIETCNGISTIDKETNCRKWDINRVDGTFTIDNWKGKARGTGKCSTLVNRAF